MTDRRHGARHPRCARFCSRVGIALLLLVHTLFVAAGDVDLVVAPFAKAAKSEPLSCTPIDTTLIRCDSNENYDRGNLDARANLAKGVLDKLSDDFDYLVVFSTFDFDKGGATAFITNIRNDVQGINLEVFNNAGAFGSAKLRGVIDMGNVKDINLSLGTPGYRGWLNILAHEVMHSFGVYVGYTDQNGVRQSLQDAQLAHWNYFVDSDASVMYGADWNAQGAGFRADDTFHRYNDLDLYLAGLYDASEVRPIRIIRDGTNQSGLYPAIGATSAGTAEIVQMSQVLLAEGPRIPNVQNAPKRFRAGFVVLSRPTDVVSPQLKINLERFRLAFQERYSAMTHGRGLFEVIHRSKLNVGTYSQSCGGPLNLQGLVPTEDIPDLAHRWLISNLSGTCFGSNDAAAQVSRLLFLRDFPDAPAQAQVIDIRARLAATVPATTDEAAWILRAIPNHAAALAKLRANVSADGGFSLDPWFRTSTASTALALSSLPGSESVLRQAALNALRTRSLSNNGFPAFEGSPSRSLSTAQVLLAMRDAGVASSDPQLRAAATWLATRRVPISQPFSGGVSDYPAELTYNPSLLETSNTLEYSYDAALEGFVKRSFRINPGPSNTVKDADALRDDYTTANAGRVLLLNTRANLKITSMRAAVDTATTGFIEGDVVKVSATIKNESAFNISTPFKIRWYDGDPAAGGVPIGPEEILTDFPANAGLEKTISIDTTGRSGVRNVYLALDTDNVITERNELDNVLAQGLDIAAAPLSADLIMTDAAAIPSQLTSFPSAVTFRGVIYNRGKTAVSSAVVALYARGFTGRVELARISINAPAQTRTPFILTRTFNASDELRLALTVDPDNAVVEANETNNEALLNVGLTASVDVEVTPADIELPAQLIAGDAAIFKVTFRNRGVSATPVIRAQLSVNACKAPALGDAAQGVSIPAGGSVQSLFTLIVPAAGAFSVCAEIDAENNLAETDEGNNQASKTASATAPTQPNLAFVLDSLVFNPNPALEAQALNTKVRVVNYGAATATPVLLTMYAADPSSGAPAIASTTLPAIASGANSEATINIAALTLRGNKTIYLKVDPDNTIIERNENDNLLIQELVVRALPDLSVNTSSIRITPSLPIPGQQMTASVSVVNLGGQPANNIRVELFDGSSTNLVAPLQTITGLMSGAATNVSFNWLLNANTSGVTAKLDGINAITEVSETNNAATLNFQTQSGDQFITEAYFSPNGDGVKDTTTIGFRLNAAKTTDVLIVRANTSSEVRRFTGAALNSTQTPQIEWDGIDLYGEVASDGEYRVVLLDRATQDELKSINVVLDTNQSELLEAVGTDHANFKKINDIQPNTLGIIPNIQSPNRYDVIYTGRKLIGGNNRYQLMRFNSTSGKSVPIISEAWIAANISPGAYIQGWLTPSGREVVFKAGQGAAQQRFYRSGLEANDQPVRIPILPYAFDLYGMNIRSALLDEHTLVVNSGNGKSILIDTLTGDLTEINIPSGLAVIGANVSGLVVFQNALAGIGSKIGVVSRNPAVAPFIYSSSQGVITEISGDYKFALYQSIELQNTCNFVLVDLTAGARRLLNAQACILNGSFTNNDKNVTLFSKDNLFKFNLNGILVGSSALVKIYPIPSYQPKQDVIRVPRPNSDNFDFFYGLYFPCSIKATMGSLIKSVSEDRISFTLSNELKIAENCLNPARTALRPGISHSISFLTGGNRSYTDRITSSWPLVDTSVLTPLAAIPIALFSKNTAYVATSLGNKIQLTQNGAPLPLAGIIPSDVLWRDGSHAYGAFDGRAFTNGTKLSTLGVYSTLNNLSVALSAKNFPTSIELEGYAADKNFDSWYLESSPNVEPRQWSEVLPRQFEERKGESLYSYSPEPGYYVIRLTVRDKAGNEAYSLARGVSSSPAAAIQSIEMGPSDFSPNGDGVKDQFFVRFNVIRPVSSSIKILSTLGELLQTLPITFDANALGAKAIELSALYALADGNYLISLEGVVRPVRVDRVAPVISRTNISYKPMFLTNSGLYLFHYEVPADLYDRAWIERADRSASNSPWVMLSDVPIFDSGSNEGNTPLDGRDFDRWRFRLVVQDRAGNKTVSPSLDGEPKLWLLALSYQEAPERQTFVDPPFVDSVVPNRLPWPFLPNRHLQLHAEEVSNQRLHDVALEVKDSHTGWQRIPLQASAISSSSVLQDYALALNPSPLAPIYFNPQAFVVPALAEFDPIISIRLVGQSFQNEIVRSNSEIINRQPLEGPFELYVDAYNKCDEPRSLSSAICAKQDELKAQLPPPTYNKNYIWVRSYLAQQLVQPLLVYRVSTTSAISAPIRPKFIIGSEYIFEIDAPQVRVCNDNDPVYSYFEFTAKNNIDENFSIITGNASGDPSIPALNKIVLGSNCNFNNRLLIELRTNPVCASTSTAILYDANLTCDIPQSPNLLKLVAVNIQNGEQHVIFSQANGLQCDTTPRTYLSGSFDPSEWSEGLYKFTSTSRGLGINSDYSFTYFISHEIPTLRIDRPAVDEKICLFDAAGAPNKFRILGEASAPRYGATLKFSLAGEHFQREITSSSELATIPDSFNILPTALGEVDQPVIMATLTTPGGLEACLERPIQLDGAVKVRYNMSASTFSEGIPRLGVSTRGALEFRTARAEFLVGERVQHAATAAAVQLDASGNITATGPATATGSGMFVPPTLAPAGLTIPWDGKFAGTAAPDGMYVFQSQFLDDCLNKKTLGQLVEVDSTPPVLSFLAPLQASSVGASPNTPIAANIADKNMATWQLLDASGGVILAGTKTQAGPLGFWNTAELSGPQTLKLIALDALGNRTEIVLNVTIVPGNRALLSYTASPSLISPNNDAVLDETQIRYSLKTAARVTLKVLGGAGLVATLVNDELKPAGNYSLPWRGLNAANTVVSDAAYGAEISVLGAGAGAILETETLVVTVDTTPPLLEVLRPNSAFVDASGYAKARLSDLHFDFADAELIPPGANIVPQRISSIAEGEQFLFDLSALLDGVARLSLQARDLAGNRTLLERAFTVDRTPPAVALTVPAEAALLATRLGVVRVKGSATDLHFASRELSLLSTAVGAVPQVLQTASTPVSDAEFYNFNPNVPDGSYRLTLKATDVVGLSSSVLHNIEIDNTPPVVSIDAPLPAAIIGAQLEVRGSVADAHIERYSVAIANPVDAAANRWTELAGDSVVRDHAVLSSGALNLSDGAYKLRLSALDKLGHSAEQIIAITLDSQPPAAPINLTASSSDQTNVDLRWNPVGATDLAGYAIYREGIRLNSALNVPVSYRDLNAPEAQLHYQVSAFDRGGNESARSNIAEISLDRTPPDVAIVQPDNNARVRGVFDIVGTADTTQDDFDRYKLTATPILPTGPPRVLTDSPQPVQIGKLGVLDSTSFAAETRVRLSLSALDTNHNAAATAIEVVIDNQAPTAPTNLSLSLNCGTGVQASWTAINVSDLLGYILYRDGELVNYAGSLPADLRPFAISATSFTDANVGDGAHSYTLYAIDLAGNISATGASASVTRSCGPPDLEITEPVFNQEFEVSIDVLGESNDRDIASVAFSTRRVGDPDWLALGTPISQAPYRARFTPAAGSALGDYEIRGIATDTDGLLDPTPAVVQVKFVDKTPPALPLGLTARVDEGQIRLTWTASTSPDVAAYRLNSSYDGIVLPETPLALSLTQEDRADSNYGFRIQAVDASNNYSPFSLPAVAALVYTPAVAQPYTPVQNSALVFSGKSARGGSVQLRRDSVDIATANTNASGDFSAALTLARGTHRYDAKVTESSGDKSKRAAIVMGFDNKPAAPTGLSVLATGQSVRASWNANAEDNILGYRLFRNLSPVLLDREASDLIAVDSVEQPITQLTDTDLDSVWRINYNLGGTYAATQFAELRLPEPIVVSGVKLHWHTERTRAVSYRIEARFVDDIFVPVATISNNADLDNEVLFAQPYRTDRLRIVPLLPTYLEPLELSTASVIERPLFSALMHTETLSDGRYDFQVSAVNAYAFESALSPAVRLDLGDVTPPPSVVLNGVLTGSDIALNWNAANAPDTAFYNLYRNGVKLARINHPALAYLDARLRNGSYAYRVKALDAFENASAASNEVSFTVNVTRLNKPENLTVVPVPAGRALDVSWRAGPGPQPSFYRVRRSLSQTGPFTLISSPSATNLRDLGLTNGTRYWYTVEALDLAGNESGQTDPVSGVPLDSAPPMGAALIAPTLPNRPIAVRATATAVAGFASTTEAGAYAQIFQNGAPLLRTPISVEQTTTVLSPFTFSTNGITAAPIGSLVYVHTASTGTLWNAATDTRLSVPEGNAAFSRDAVELYISKRPSGTLSSVKRINTMTGVTSDLELGLSAIVFALPVATSSTLPGNEKLLVAGVRTVAGVATDSLWLVDPSALNTMQILGAQPSLALNAATARVAPDGKTAAVLRSDGHLLLITFASANVQDIASDVSDAPALQADSSAVVFTQTNGALKRLMRYNTANQTTDIWLSAPNISFSLPIFDNSGVQLLTRKVDSAGTSIEAHVWPTGALTGTTVYSGRFVFLGSSQWLLNNSDQMRRVSPVGWFGIDELSLSPGANLFTAVVFDAAGNASQASPAISVTSLSPSLLKPDLAISSSDVRFIPATGLVGTDVGALVTLRNLGAAASSASTLSARLRRPDGTLQNLGLRVIPALAIGAQATLSLPLGVQNIAGLVGVDVSIDPDNTLDESNEANNVARAELPITIDGRPSITVVPDQLIFAPGVEPSAALRVLNPASRFAGKIKVRVEDASGALVLELADVVVPSLNFGQVFNARVRWPNTNAFAGSYRFNAKLIDEQGDFVAADIAGFAVAANRNIQLGINTDRTSYSRSNTARISVPLSFSSGNTLLENAQLQIVVRNAANVEVARSDRALGTLLPGYQGQSVLNLVLTNFASGIYTASADLAATSFNTGAQRSFIVLDDAPAAQLAAGDITVSNNPLGITLPGSAEGVVSNIGSGAIAPMQARLTLISAPGLAQIKQELATSNLNPGASLRLPMNLGALNLALGNYLLILEGQYPGDPTWRALSSRSLRVTDLIPPEITPLTPDSAATPMRLPANLNARVLDRHSAVATVEIQVDGGAFVPVARDIDGSYSAQLNALTDGTHSLSWRAVDSYGNQSQTPATPFVIDTTPPLIVITGVSEGQISAAALNPAYLVTDNDLASSGATLNGAPFATASVVTLDNSYTLFVYGADRAGNRAERVVHFAIERAPPDLSFVEPLNNAVIDAANTPAILRTEPFASVTLNQGAFSAAAIADQFGTVNIAVVPLAFGSNTLSARATDRAGNQSAIVSVSVTRPQGGLPLSGTLGASGAQIALGLPVGLSFAVNNGASTALVALPLRLRLYANSNPVPIASREFNRDIPALGSTNGVENFAASVFSLGSYSASLEANVSGAWTLLADAGFSVIDPNPPTLSVQIPTLNQVLGAAARFKVTAADAESGLDKVDYRVDSGAWINFGAGTAGQFESGNLDAINEGAHSFQARATDLAGNQTTGTQIAFALDRTPPAISFANVAAGGLYNVNVTPSISITDAHSFNATQTLNGATYVTGTAITADGSYALLVSATDIVGNASSASVSFLIDKTPPLVTFTYPANGAVLGVDFTRIDGRTEANASLRLTLAGTNYLVRADAAGGFTVPSVPLLDGNNQVSARAIDAAGNTGPDASLSIIYRLNAGASLSGNITSFAAAIPLGQPVNALYRVRNTGASVIRNLPVRLEFQRSGGASVIDTQEFTVIELLTGAFSDGTRVFQTTGQPPGAYLVTLSAQLPDAAGGKPIWAVLDTQALSLGDVIPPVVSILAPPANSYQRGEFSVVVRATDLSSAITRVEAKLSDNAWVDLLPVPNQLGSYSGLIAHNVEEATQISARATDAAGNVSAIATRPVRIDLNPPVITVPNIFEAALLNVAITPVITVQDFSPTEKVLTLNGLAYVEGTAISSDGDYVLRISATDAVNRSSVLERRFKLDRTPPVITITYPPKGQSTQLGQVRVSGLTEGLAAVTLRNATLAIPVAADAQGGFTLAEMPLTIGDNVITAQARDLAGNLSNTASVTVVRVGVNGPGLDGVIDALAPDSTHGQPIPVRAELINIGTVDLSATPMRWVARSVQSGAELSEQLFPLTLAAGRPLGVEASFLTTSWPLGLVEISLETQLTSAGRASVAWRVLDRKQTRIVDRVPPVISWIAPIANAYVVPGEVLITNAFDVLSGIASVEAKLDDGKWQLMSPLAAPANRFGLSMPDAAPGPHTLTARAFDVAGNSAITPVLPIRVREVLALTIDTPSEGAVLSIARTDVSGLTKPRATVSLTIASASYTTTAEKDGRYSFTGIALASGSNTMRAIASDSEGNSSLPVLRTVRVTLLVPSQTIPVPIKPITYWLMLGLMLLLGMLATRRDAR